MAVKECQVCQVLEPVWRWQNVIYRHHVQLDERFLTTARYMARSDYGERDGIVFLEAIMGQLKDPDVLIGSEQTRG